MRPWFILPIIVSMAFSVSCAFGAGTTVQTFTYKTSGEKQLEIHVHYPPDWKSSDSRPVMIFFFGGGWTGGTTNQFMDQADYFASRGMVTARADYRVKSRDGVTPDQCVEDARSAVRWLRKNAQQLGIDPQRLVSSGGSAGGHLAACMIIEKSVDTEGDDLSISTMPQAMVLFNPVLSFESEQILVRLGDKKHLAKRISPTAHLHKGCPPALILFGTDDRLKVFGDRYWEKAEGLGVRADKYLAEGQGHGFFNRSPWKERTMIAADEFLASLGLLKGKPTVEVPEEATQQRRRGQGRDGSGSRRVHPNSANWQEVFETDLSNAIYPKGVWSVEGGVLTASEDQAIWTEKAYDNFVLDLEFKTAAGTNSGVIVYGSDIKNWIPNSVEIQIADDHSEQWGNADKTWQCGAIFGRLAASESRVKEPGQWNRFTIRCRDHNIAVALNGAAIVAMDMRRWKNAKKNPDGTDIPSWLSKPLAELPTKGRIGLQGKHAGAPVWFRNIKIRELK